MKPSGGVFIVDKANISTNGYSEIFGFRNSGIVEI